MKMLSYGRQSISQEDIEAVQRALESDFITQGPIVEEFEQMLCSFTGARFAVAVTNGTAALYLACRALEVGKESLGVTTPLTFVASASCVVLCGGRVDFVDVDKENMNMVPEFLEEYCKKVSVPDVVIPVDFAGLPCRLEDFWRLSKEFGFKIIEDAAHSIGSSYKNSEGQWTQCGGCEHSHLAIFSFHPVKNITSGEGGAVLTNDPSLAKRLKILREHGIERQTPWRYDIKDLSLNFRLSAIHAALGISQLKRLELFKKKRNSLFNAYLNRLSDLEKKEKVFLPKAKADASVCWHLFVLRLGPAARISRDELLERLMDYGIQAQIHYRLVCDFTYFKQSNMKGSELENAKEISESCLSLPLFPDLKEEQLDKVCQVLEELL